MLCLAELRKRQGLLNRQAGEQVASVAATELVNAERVGFGSDDRPDPVPTANGWRSAQQMRRLP